MISTHDLVNELLSAMSAGLVYKRNEIPVECQKVFTKSSVDSSESLAEFRRVLNHMMRIDLIQKEKLSDGNTYIILTHKGKKRLKSASIKSISIPKPKSWDGKWRVLSFDIPRDMRSKRYEFLRELHRLGFEKVLQSMWVYPFPCESEIKSLASALGLSESIMLMEASLDKENHDSLLKHFAYIL